MRQPTASPAVRKARRTAGSRTRRGPSSVRKISGKKREAQASSQHPGASSRETGENSIDLRAVLDALPLLVSYVRKDLRLCFANAAYRDWFCVGRKTILGKHVRDFLEKDTWRRVQPRMVAALKGEHFGFQVRMPFKRRGTRVLQVDYIPHRDRSGQVQGFYAFMRDITGQMKAESEVLARETFNQAVFNSLAVCVVILDREGTILEITEGCRHGRKTGEAILRRTKVGMNYASLYRDLAEAAKIREGLDGVLQTNSHFQCEYSRGTEPRSKWYLMLACPLRGGNGGAVISHTEITELKRRETKLLRETIARVAEEEQKRIARDLHDGLGQLLTGTMHLAAGLAQSRGHFDPDLTRETSRIVQLLDGAIAQTRQLAHGLYPVRAETGGLTAALAELARETSELFHVDCRVRFTGVPPVKNLAAATHLYRIAQEAVQNAIRHGESSKIIISLTVRDHRALLSVRDNGRGFGKRPPGGARGIGFQSMRSRASILGGTISVTSRAASGATIQCSFPKSVLIEQSGTLGHEKPR